MEIFYSSSIDAVIDILLLGIVIAGAWGASKGYDQ
jgi:hypothetical protein